MVRKKAVADVIGWVGNILFFSGGLLIAYKSTWGFVANGLGNVCYVVQGIFVGLPSLTAVSCGLIATNMYGLYKWAGE